VKAAELSWFFVDVYTGSVEHRVWFNVSTGVLGTKEAGITSASITAVSSGWYRVVATFTQAVSSVTMRFASADNTTTSTAASGEGMYFWGAQMEAGSTVTSYIPTTTASVTRAADNIFLTEHLSGPVHDRARLPRRIPAATSKYRDRVVNGERRFIYASAGVQARRFS
jgi:hypothetical protein